MKKLLQFLGVLFVGTFLLVLRALFTGLAAGLLWCDDRVEETVNFLEPYLGINDHD